ncbi:hypothetical protein GGI64_004115 [Rhizobium leguminosarum]|uniref:Lipoprotein n=1 Tax=Rhizobium leguminosarum TaxID=384 RepID=A0A7Z0E1T5_RHILE|nr:hypothetical protein [Rhizobium leguminosarum]NYJ13034.1 hypothetical protein [Rhizobium leguminosarum]
MIELFVCRPLRLCTIVLLMLSIGSCQVMDSTITYEVRPDGKTARRCDSALGSYSLPISTIKITVTQMYKGTSPVDGALLNVSAPEPHPDRDPKHLFCLDFLENGFSDDTVTVAYSGSTKVNQTEAPSMTASTGMLSVIASKSIDRTGDVIRNLIRAIFILASRDVSFGRTQPTGAEVPVIMTQQSVNPFDLQAMAALNRSLHDYGYCLTFGNYTYNTSRLKPDDYCNNPSISLPADARPPLLEAAESQQYLVKQFPVGIFYRPRQPYSMFVYVRDDPGRGPWELRKIDTVMLENLSPILVLKVNRTIFAEYRTVLAFDRGNLVDVCIGKGSEVAGALQIPLDIIYGIVSLPSAAIVKEIGNKRSTQELLDAQKELLTLQNSILKAQPGTFPGASKTADGEPLAKIDYTHNQLEAPELDGNIPPDQSTKFGTLCPLLSNASASL